MISTQGIKRDVSICGVYQPSLAVSGALPLAVRVAAQKSSILRLVMSSSRSCSESSVSVVAHRVGDEGRPPAAVG